MTPASQPAQPKSKRDLALKVAEGLLRDQGYLGVSMELVARGAGLRKPGLYHHFPGGKEEMMMVLAERLMARAEGGFRMAITPQPTALSQLGALATWMFAEGRHTERMLRDVLRFVEPERQATLYGSFERQLLAQVRAALDAGGTKRRASSAQHRTLDVGLHGPALRVRGDRAPGGREPGRVAD